MAAKAKGPKMPAPRPAKPAAVPAVALMRPYLSHTAKCMIKND